jgi:Ser/Thr protein kinase RdoA (MazF antagonist)
MVISLRDICEHFPIVGVVQRVEVYGSGHINDTYKITADNGLFILQKINTLVFKDVQGLTNNFLRVSRFFAAQNRISEARIQVPELYPTNEGNYLFEESPRDYWRLMNFIPDSRSFDKVEDAALAREGGRAYGLFFRMLDNFPVEDLTETIPDFHNLEFRWRNFQKSLQKDRARRVKEAKDEIRFVEKRIDGMREIIRPAVAGKLPLRVTHNDTKINNVLFNQSGRAVAVVDLDTVMPGFVLYDFGDAVRTFCNTALEDEQDLGKVHFNIGYFEQFHTGFLEEAEPVLTAGERALLPASARLMTFIIGLRFLTDFLDGDTYYKTAYPTHNLIRTKGQFKLLHEMEMAGL